MFECRIKNIKRDIDKLINLFLHLALMSINESFFDKLCHVIHSLVCEILIKLGVILK
jgi:hypothetical protein